MYYSASIGAGHLGIRPPAEYAGFDPLRYAAQAVTVDDGTAQLKNYWSDGQAWNQIPRNVDQRATIYMRPGPAIYAAAVALLTTLIRQWDSCEWLASETVAVGALRVPTVFKNFNNTVTLKVFRATAITTGLTATAEPAWPTTAGLTVVDGGVTWTAYAVSFFDADAGSDAADGSQATPFKTLAKLTVFGGAASLRSGNAVYFKRGCVNAYTGAQPGVSTNQIIAVVKDGSDVTQDRRFLGAWGVGSVPRFDGTGKQFGINCGTSSGTGANNNCNLTVSDLEIFGINVDTAPGNGLGGIGIYVPTTTSAIRTDLKVFRCHIHGINNPAAAVAGTDDFDGIACHGRGMLVADSHIHDIDDDGLWTDGDDDTVVLLNRIYKVAQSYNRVGRVAGDCLQFGGTGANNNPIIWSNVLDHSSAGCKQVLLANPAVASTGWSVIGNTIISATGFTTTAHIVCYLARVSGVMSFNHFHSNRAYDGTSGYILIAGTFTGEGNVVWLRNGGGGLLLAQSLDAGNPNASNSRLDFTTAIGVGLTPGAFGIQVDAQALNVQLYNTAVLNCAKGIFHRSTGVVGAAAYQNCASGTAGDGAFTRDGVDTVGDNLYSIYGRPESGGAAVGAGSPVPYKTDAFGNMRLNPPTPGAYEVAMTALPNQL